MVLFTPVQQLHRPARRYFWQLLHRFGADGQRRILLRCRREQFWLRHQQHRLSHHPVLARAPHPAHQCLHSHQQGRELFRVGIRNHSHAGHLGAHWQRDQSRLVELQWNVDFRQFFRGDLLRLQQQRRHPLCVELDRRLRQPRQRDQLFHRSFECPRRCHQQPGGPDHFDRPTGFLSVAASGSPPLLYQWYYNNASLGVSGASSQLELDNVSTTNSGLYKCVVSNSVGSATGSNITLTVYDAPVVLVQPVNTTVAFSSNTVLSAVVAGSSPLTFQWYFSPDDDNDYSPLPDGTNSSYTIFGAQAPDAGYYYLTVINLSGAATSAVANLTVSGNPIIVTQPSSLKAAVGSNVTFTVGFSGGNPDFYQWYYAVQTNDFQPLPDGTNATYTITGCQTNNSGFYYLFAGNSFGSVTSSVASLTVLVPPAVLVQPANIIVATNRATNFVIFATGSTPVRGWWYRATSTNSPTYTSLGTILLTNLSVSGNASLGAMTGSNLNGTLRFSFNFGTSNVTTAANGNYYLVLSNSVGIVTSSVASMSVLIPPRVISLQPTNVAALPGDTVYLYAGASGSQPLTYQWLLNGTPLGLPNSTSYMLELDNISTNDTGAYGVIVSNPVGSATSSNIIVTVYTSPVVIGQPSNLAVLVGSNATFNASVIGVNPVTYQWYFSPDDNNDYQLLPDGTDSSYTITGAQTNNAGCYYLFASNDYGSTTSSKAHLNVLYNGASTAPYLWLLSHNPTGDSIMIALESGRNYRVQASADLLTWADVTNFLSHSSLVAFTNAAFSGMPSMYYRVVTP
ncbi:MAG: immunoglobulin domain-containing protein, partial [Verrucomicrobia bacterium]|nr:immunoglobulin domain-containing protein [Verrucomicrobiota bacterium]